MKNIEIEIQVRVENAKILEEFLEKEASFAVEEHQKDEYFTPIHRNFIAGKPVDEWLRLRESDKNSITYKNWHHDKNTGKTNSCDEYETKLDDIDQMRKIFKVLDIKPIITVDKKRRSWNYRDWEVSIDQIKDLGDFVEIEYKGNEPVDPAKETDTMINFLKETGVGKIERNYVGYPYLLMYKEENQFEVV